MKSFIVFFILFIQLFAENKDFDLYKKETNKEGNTLLIIGAVAESMIVLLVLSFLYPKGLTPGK